MNARLATYSPLPILRLLLAPRTFVVLIGGASWTLGSAFLGTMARFNALDLDPQIESAVFRALVACLLLYGLSALLGVVVGEAAQEIFRRPMLNRLPGITKRVSRAALVLGVAWVSILTAALQLTWQPLDLRLSASSAELPCPLATLAIACTGFAAGSWLLARVGHGWSWILRFLAFAGLANFALPLLQTGTESTPVAVLLLVISLLAASQRYRPGIVRIMAEGSVPTIFGSIKDWKDTNRAPTSQVRPPSKLMPPKQFEKNIVGWEKAESYARHTALNWISPRQAMLAIAAYSFLIVHLIAILGWLAGGKSSEENSVAFLAQRLFSGLGTTEQDHESVVLIFGMTAGGLAFLSSQFADRYFQPISRVMKARLSFRSSLCSGLGLAVSTLGLGVAYGALLRALGVTPWHSGLPIYAFAVMLGLLLYPLFYLLSVRMKISLARGHYLRSGVFLIVAFGTAPVLLVKASGPSAAALISHSPWLAATAYLLAVVLAFGLLRFFLGRHFRRADLVVG